MSYCKTLKKVLYLDKTFIYDLTYIVTPPEFYGELLVYHQSMDL